MIQTFMLWSRTNILMKRTARERWANKRIRETRSASTQLTHRRLLSRTKIKILKKKIKWFLLVRNRKKLTSKKAVYSLHRLTQARKSWTKHRSIVKLSSVLLIASKMKTRKVITHQLTIIKRKDDINKKENCYFVKYLNKY